MEVAWEPGVLGSESGGGGGLRVLGWAEVAVRTGHEADRSRQESRGSDCTHQRWSCWGSSSGRSSPSSVGLHGGCTLILDLDTLALRYAIGKPIADRQREAAYLRWLGDNPTAAALVGLDEPIAYLHVTG